MHERYSKKRDKNELKNKFENENCSKYLIDLINMRFIQHNTNNLIQYIMISVHDLMHSTDATCFSKSFSFNTEIIYHK